MRLEIEETNIAPNATVSKSLQSLNSKWRNYIADICSVDSSNGVFQVLSGKFGLQTSDSSGLFLISDVIPTDSVSGSYTNFDKRRSLSYNDLIQSIEPQDGSLLRDILGSKYNSWVKFRKYYYTTKSNNWSVPQNKLFDVWSKFNLSTELATHSISIFEQSQVSPVNVAIAEYSDIINQESFVDINGGIYNLYCYTGSIGNAKNIFKSGNDIGQVNFNSDSSDDHNYNRFTQNDSAGFVNFFGAENTQLMTDLNTRAVNSKITVRGTIGKAGELSTCPGIWYDPSIVALAYHNPDDFTIWNNEYNSDSWASFFAQPNGNLSRYTTSLLVIYDYELTVTINSKFTENEYNQIKIQSVNGIWPFSSLGTESKIKKELVHTSEGYISYIISSKKDLFGILGLSFKSLILDEII